MHKQARVESEQLTITDWVKDLAAISEREFTLETVQNYIVQHSVRPETLDKYLFFSRVNYTRNLIFKNVEFVFITIDWKLGQLTRIPNHRDQNSGMSSLMGRAP